MSTSAIGYPAAAGAKPGTGLNVLLWCVQVLLAVAFFAAGVAKLTGNPQMIALFAAIGLGQWFRYVTGILELAGAVLVVVPNTRSIGAALLIPIMLGAIVTTLFVVPAAPTAPLVLLLLAAFVVWGRRQELARLIGR